MKTEREQLIALAGLYQATYLTQQIARRGMANTADIEASIYSLFQIDAESVEAVYGGLEGVATGLQQLRNQLLSMGKQGLEASQYAVTLLHLERKLANNAAMLQQVSEGITGATERLDYYPMLHSTTLANIADIYANTISTLQPRIMVSGEPMHLQNPENTNKIRTLLLAGIRSAMLWRQCGGTRFKVLLGRRRLAALADSLLEEIKQRNIDKQQDLS